MCVWEGCITLSLQEQDWTLLHYEVMGESSMRMNELGCICLTSQNVPSGTWTESWCRIYRRRRSHTFCAQPGWEVKYARGPSTQLIWMKLQALGKNFNLHSLTFSHLIIKAIHALPVTSLNTLIQYYTIFHISDL